MPDRDLAADQKTCEAATPANTCEVMGPVTRLFLRRVDGTVIPALIDTADLERVRSTGRAWVPSWSAGHKQYRVQGPIGHGQAQRYVFLHRFILDAPSDLLVDHINHDCLDNRRSNLRLVDRSGNGQNRTGADIRSKSGIRNVSWDAAKGKWVVFVKVNRKSRYIGRYDSIEEAESAAKTARAEMMPFSEEATAHA